jgi:hopanoid biosynthesis associated RND transporter like protein HpnN
MLSTFISQTIRFCSERAWVVVIGFLLLAIASGIYTKRHFAIDTNIDNLISDDLPWRKRSLEYKAAFPQRSHQIIAVVEAPTAELTDTAARTLSDTLSKNTALFPTIQIAGGGPFFQKNGMLFLPVDQLKASTNNLMDAEPLITTLAKDPTLRGLMHALTDVLEGVRGGDLSLDDMAKLMSQSSDTLESIPTSPLPSFSWRKVLQKPDQPDGLRKIVVVTTVLDTTSIQPGKRSTDAIRQAVQDLDLKGNFGATVKLTGTVPIADEEFSSVNDGVALNGAITGILILSILWLALRSVRMVLAVAVSLAVGLVITAASGILLVGAFNPISIAFAVLFVGIGADFAIQYGVQYRQHRFDMKDRDAALIETGHYVGAPLTLAAIAAAIGFLSFVPTAYSGIAQLGKIAGFGMIVAYVVSLTLLPTLFKLVRPPEEHKKLNQPSLIPVDHFLKRHRLWVVGLVSVVVLAGSPSLVHLKFDFNPLHLRDQHSEAVSTYVELSKDPVLGAQSAQVLAKNHEEALAIAKKLAPLPEVSQVRTVDVLIPTDQPEKLDLIKNAGQVLAGSLAAPLLPAPSDAENVKALTDGAQALAEVAAGKTGPGADAANRLAGNLKTLASADQTARDKATRAFGFSLTESLDGLRLAFQAGPIDRQTIPASLLQDWVAPDGREKVDILPKGDPNDNTTLLNFARAVLAAEPNATGSATDTLNWGSTIIWAFAQASLFALLSIAVLLWVVLRSLRDVMATLVPLIVAGLMTFEICAMTGFALNYANIIALPVLLGVGVAFKIYYIVAWQRGQTDFLQSTLTRAVFFSAVLTAIAFGSLWFSIHPGTSSMGKLLALSFTCTLVSAVLFQPALMGEPRKPREV